MCWSCGYLTEPDVERVQPAHQSVRKREHLGIGEGDRIAAQRRSRARLPRRCRPRPPTGPESIPDWDRLRCRPPRRTRPCPPTSWRRAAPTPRRRTNTTWSARDHPVGTRRGTSRPLPSAASHHHLQWVDDRGAPDSSQGHASIVIRRDERLALCEIRAADLLVARPAAHHHDHSALHPGPSATSAPAEGVDQPAPPGLRPDPCAVSEPAVDRRQVLVAVPPGLYAVSGARRALAGAAAMAARGARVSRRSNVSERGIPLLEDPGGGVLTQADRRARHRRELLRRRHRRRAHLPHSPTVAMALRRRRPGRLRRLIGRKTRFHPTRTLQCAAARARVLPADPYSAARARGCVNSALWRSMTTTSNASAAAWNSHAWRSATAMNLSARFWSTATAPRFTRTATASWAATTPATPNSRSPAGRSTT